VTAATPDRPRLVVSDLDGTLLRTDSTFSARTVAAVEAVQAAGIQWIVATARPPRWMHRLLPLVGLEGVAVCSNGAFVYDVHGRLILDERPIVDGVLSALVADLRAAVPGIAFAAEARGGLTRESQFDDVHREVDAAVIDDVLELPSPPGKLLARSSDLEAAEFIDLVTDVTGDRAVVAYSGATGLAEISAAGVTKAAVLDELCRERDIEPRDVWAFGDMPNDLAMMRWAGTSYAVANAHPDVHAVADHVVASHDEDGVAKVLESLSPTPSR
jgi:Cof subfamily protein (haloacid dehalogenase superfamily)